MRFLLFLSLTLVFGIIQIHAQLDLNGTVYDDENLPLIGATAVLLEQQDSTMISFGITNDQGKFTFESLDKGAYILQISYVSYANYSQPLEVDWTQSQVELNPIILKESSEVLQEVTIKAEHIPLGISGDTINYNTAAFKTRPGASVEDLLKKLPGIEVQRDGSIKANGEDVENVLVEGKTFFGKDPKIATKNLEAEAVDKVQVYDKQSEIAEFTGIDDGHEEKTINLKLKEGYKAGGFGNIELKGGTEDTYLAKLNYNRFNTKLQASTILSSNNINEQAFSFDEYISMMGGLQSAFSGGMSNFNFSEFGNNQAPEGLLTNISGGINLNYDFSEKILWTSNYFYLSLDKKLRKNSISTQFLDRNQYTTTDSISSINQNANHRINTKLIFKTNPFLEFIIKNNLQATATNLNSESETKTISDLISNNINGTNTLDNDLYNFTNEVQIRKKFNAKGRNWISKINHQVSRLTENNQIAQDFLLVSNNINVLQRQDYVSKSQTISLESTFTEPLGNGKYLGFNYSISGQREEPTKQFFDISEQGSTLNELLSAEFISKNQIQNLGLSFRKNTKKSKFNLNINYQTNTLNNTIFNQSIESNIDRNFKFILPSINYSKDLTSSSTIKLDYNTSIITPKLNQLIPIPDNTNPNVLILGNPALNPSYTHSFQMSYNLFDQFNFRNLFANLSFNIIEDRVVNKINIDENFLRTIQAINTNRTFSGNLFLSYSEPIKSLGIKYRFNMQSSLFSYDSFLNDSETGVSETKSNINLIIENRKKEKIDLAGGIKVDYNTRTYSINDQFNQNFFNYTLFTEIDWYLTKQLSVSSSLDAVHFSDETFAGQQDFLLWNGHIEYTFQDNKYSIQLSAFDILGQNKGISRFGGLNSLNVSTYNTLQRFINLGLRYRIGKTRKSGISFG